MTRPKQGSSPPRRTSPSPPHPPTPGIIIDGQKVQQNLSRMADYASSHGLKLRPHTKTHKSLRMASLQLELGAIGLTVAKVGEAEVMSQVCDDIMIAYPLVDAERCRRAAELARRITLRVAIDSTLAAERLSSAADAAGSMVHVLVDIDVGYGRTGVQSDEAALKLAEVIDRLPALHLDGIMIYTGNVTGPVQRRKSLMQAIQRRLESILSQWTSSGFSTEIVSGGSTPSAMQSHLIPALTEFRPGTYIFNDMNIVRGGYGTIDDCAARIHSTVVSNNVDGQIVIDAGSKTLTSDLCGPAPDTGHGYLIDYPDAKIFRLTEEHGQVDISHCQRKPVLGEVITIIPNHICVCMNMQDRVWWSDGLGTFDEMAIDARGKLV